MSSNLDGTLQQLVTEVATKQAQVSVLEVECDTLRQLARQQREHIEHLEHPGTPLMLREIESTEGERAWFLFAGDVVIARAAGYQDFMNGWMSCDARHIHVVPFGGTDEEAQRDCRW